MEPTYERTPQPTSSPWGAVDHAKEYAPGIWSVSTSSHGGFRLSDARNAAVPDYWRAADGWYEEDCMWAVVCAVWPEAFTETWRQQADVSLRNWQPDGYEAFYGVVLKAGESHKKDERAFWLQHADDYIARSAFGDQWEWVPQGFVGVCAGRGRREPCGSPVEERWFLVPEPEYRTGPFGLVINRERHAEIEKPANRHVRRQRVAA
ncbi:MAG: hypothetical protein Q8R98_17830 [Rubrivivax sp.]|nr:hypothetical protein [Rubrivivax sp.]